MAKRTGAGTSIIINGVESNGWVYGVDFKIRPNADTAALIEFSSPRIETDPDTGRITVHINTTGGETDRAKLERIAALEVHGGEFIDAAEVYRILGKPIPAAVDHAANIRNEASA